MFEWSKQVDKQANQRMSRYFTLICYNYATKLIVLKNKEKKKTEPN